jgi:hypothetical protein
MQVTNEITPGDSDLSENTDDLFYALLNGKTVSEKIKTSRGEFVVKFPKQKDIERIGLLVANRRNGIPAQCFDTSSENEIYKCAVLDVMVESGPVWYENAKNKNQNFSWRDMPDGDFVSEVYLMAHSFRQETQAKFKRPEKQIAGENERKDVQASVGGDVFSGASSSNSGN